LNTGGTVHTQISQNARTLTSFVITLLEYPRWVIDRDVDFTNCRHGGHYRAELDECVTCRFAAACRWLEDNSPMAESTASFDRLVDTLNAAIGYFESTTDHGRGCRCDTCAWLRKARRFRKTRPETT
jgi:hypothetical protein